MEAIKGGGSKRVRMAADLFWFAAASIAAGLFAAIAVAALAMLLAQPARAEGAHPVTTSARDAVNSSHSPAE